MSEHKTTLFKGKVYRLVPDPPRKKGTSACDSCALKPMSCSEVNCDGHILIEDTPEALAQYIATRMTT